MWDVDVGGGGKEEDARRLGRCQLCMAACGTWLGSPVPGRLGSITGLAMLALALLNLRNEFVLWRFGC